HEPQVLFRFADVLAHNLAQIDAVQVEPELVCKHLGGHRLARAARAREQCAYPEPSRALGCESPLIINFRSPPDMSCDIPQSLTLGIGQYEVVPGSRWLYPLAQVVQARASLRAAGIPERRLRCAAVSRVEPGFDCCARSAHRLRAQAELRNKHWQVPIDLGCERPEHFSPQ